MKKTLVLISILLIAAFAVFAGVPVVQSPDQADQSVTLQSTIPSVNSINYSLGYGTDGSAFTYLSDTSVSANVTPTDAVNANGEEYFQVKTNQQVNLSADDTLIYYLDISATPWVLDSLAAGASPLATQTNGVTLSALSPIATAAATATNHVKMAVDTTTDSKKAVMTYTPGVTATDIALFSFNVTWVANANLEAGAYESTITMAYSTT